MQNPGGFKRQAFSTPQVDSKKLQKKFQKNFLSTHKWSLSVKHLSQRQGVAVLLLWRSEWF